jgi:ElaB/YqjD/DUF883 family membrane-anchored ribosome-binding protein
MAYEVPTGLRRIARELRAAAGGHGRHDLRAHGEDARVELARLWSQIEDIVEHRLAPAARDVSRDARGYARDARGYARDARGYAREYAEEGREIAMDAAHRLREATRAHPLLAIGIAAAAAWTMASLMRTRR